MLSKVSSPSIRADDDAVEASELESANLLATLFASIFNQMISFLLA